MDSSTIAISVSPNPAKGKSSEETASESEADAFSISLEVARDEAGGEPATTSITIQGVTSESGEAGADEPEGEVTIEIETVVFSGDDLEVNLSASTVLGDGSVAITTDGAFGVEGSVSGENEVRLEVGETLTFELPPADGEVVGGQVTITNLFGNGENNEGALIFAYDADDRQLAVYSATGNETGSVTVDIEVPFARLDFKAVDNDAWFLDQNSNFGVSDVTALFASVVDDLADGASELIDDVLANVGSKLAELIDLGHFGTVHFEISRVSANKLASIDALSRVNVKVDRESERQIQNDVDRSVTLQQDLPDRPFVGRAEDRVDG